MPPLLIRLSVTLFLVLPFLLLLILLSLIFVPFIFLLVSPFLCAFLWVYFLFKILHIFTSKFQEMKLTHRTNSKSCNASRVKEEIVDLDPWVLLVKENKRREEEYDDVKERLWCTVDESSWQVVAPKSAKSDETKTFKEILSFWRSKEREGLLKLG